MGVGIKSIVVEPTLVRFKSHEQDELYRACCELDDATVIEPVNDVTDVLLRDDGTRKDGLKFSRNALVQLCERISPGLSSLAQDIAGLKRRIGAYDEVIDPRLACRIINSCAKLRFRIKDGVYTRQLIIHAPSGVVDGVVGPKYKYLAHRTLYETVDELLASADIPSSFDSAVLCGRHMSMNWIVEGNLFSLSNGDEYQGGYYFSNSEGGGAGVHAAASISMVGTDMRCVSELRSVSHTGKSFNKRLGDLLVGVLVCGDARVAQLRERCAAMLVKPLGVFDEDKHQVNRTRQRVLINLLVSQGLDSAAAKSVVNWVIYGEATDEHDFIVQKMLNVQDRCVYDVLVWLMRYAATCQSMLRERVERAAFDLLMGNFDL